MAAVVFMRRRGGDAVMNGSSPRALSVAFNEEFMNCLRYFCTHVAIFTKCLAYHAFGMDDFEWIVAKMKANFELCKDVVEL